MRRFGLLPFRSPLLRKYLSRFTLGHLFSFPPGTEMFHFPGYAAVPVPRLFYCRLFSPSLFFIAEISISVWEKSKIGKNNFGTGTADFVLRNQVSPFGNLRIKGCFAPPRSISSQRHVLHRLLKSRHPPCALKFPVKKFTNHMRISLAKC